MPRGTAAERFLMGLNDELAFRGKPRSKLRSRLARPERLEARKNLVPPLRQLVPEFLAFSTSSCSDVTEFDR